VSISDWSQSEVALSKSESSINSTILPVFSLCHFEFKAVYAEVSVATGSRMGTNKHLLDEE
jgi:hypothetical protein